MLSRKQLLCLIALGVLLFVVSSAVPATAQTPPPRRRTTTEQQPPPTPRQTSPDDADISITGSATARELRFDVVPNPVVEFNGRPRRDTVWEADRQNLPGSLRPGETYRDIGIRLRITSRFADIDRIVAEALGEVPVNDDDDNSPSQQPPTPPTATPEQSPQSNPQPPTDVSTASLSSSGTSSSRAAAPPATRRRRPGRTSP